MTDSDEKWERIGRSEPYWGVATFERYKMKNLTPELRQNFFASGEQYVKQIFEAISSNVDRDFSPSLGVDFGCGVGRITIPLSRRCRRVIGVDVSPSMIAEAKRNCVLFDVTNVGFVHELARIEQKVDFINSSLVLQHIRTDRGMDIIGDFVEKLNPSGIACIQVPYSSRRPMMKRILRPIAYRSNLARKTYNAIIKKDARAPFIMMNDYDITEILRLLAEKNINKVFIPTDKYGSEGIRTCSASLFVQK